MERLRVWRVECSERKVGEVKEVGGAGREDVRGVVVREEEEGLVWMEGGRGGAARKSRKACEERQVFSLWERM